MKLFVFAKRIISRLKKFFLNLFFSDPRSLLELAYKRIGVNNFGDKKETGEEFVVKNILRDIWGDEKVIFFDVGCNSGEDSMMMREYFSQAKIYAFEPNKKVIPVAKKNLDGFDVILKNIGLGAKSGETFLYSFSSVENSELGTCNPDALDSLFGEQVKDKIEKTTFKQDSVDNFCSLNHILRINFLKIDVEGNELEVLKGSSEMIAKNLIDVIQFEFNVFNVFSRVFLKDFYKLLPDFSFFRIKEGALIPLGAYNPREEIFQYQNILAIGKNIKGYSKYVETDYS